MIQVIVSMGSQRLIEQKKLYFDKNMFLWIEIPVNSPLSIFF